MAYKTREMLLSEIKELTEHIEMMTKDHVAHVEHLNKERGQKVYDLKVIIEQMSSEIDVMKSDFRVADAILEETRKFVVDYQQILRIFAEHSSPTIIQESDMLDEGELPSA